MNVIIVEQGQRAVVGRLEERPDCWEEIAGPGWVGCVQDGNDLFNFAATELAEYLGWYESPAILCGDVVFAGEDWTDVPEFVIRAALRQTGVEG